MLKRPYFFGNIALSSVSLTAFALFPGMMCSCNPIVFPLLPSLAPWAITLVSMAQHYVFQIFWLSPVGKTWNLVPLEKLGTNPLTHRTCFRNPVFFF